MKRLPLVVERVVADVYGLQVQMAQTHLHKAQFDGTVVSCRVKCDNCCHHPFLITLAEGVLLYRKLAASGKWTPTFRKRVEEHRSKTLGASFEIWLRSNLPCPLLDNHKCSAYDFRPFHCRVTYSTGHPSLCHPHDLSAGTPLVSNTDDIVMFNRQVTAWLKRVGNAGTLMPLSAAVLLGEALEMGSLSIEDADLQLTRDFFNV